MNFSYDPRELAWYRDVFAWAKCFYNRCTPTRYTSDAGDVICFSSTSGIDSRTITVAPASRTTCADDRVITGRDLKHGRYIIENTTDEVEP